jgi:hypothetical protein
MCVTGKQCPLRRRFLAVGDVVTHLSLKVWEWNKDSIGKGVTSVTSVTSITISGVPWSLE